MVRLRVTTGTRGAEMWHQVQFYENSASVRKLFDEAGERLGLDMKALCF